MRKRIYFDEANESGIKGYVLKDSAVSDIIECIISVSNDNLLHKSECFKIFVKQKNGNQESDKEES